MSRYLGCFGAFFVSAWATVRLLLFLDGHRVVLWLLLAALIVGLGGGCWYGLRRLARAQTYPALRLLEGLLVGVLVTGLLECGLRAYDAYRPVESPPDLSASSLRQLHDRMRSCQLGWKRFREWEAGPRMARPHRVHRLGPDELLELTSQLESGWRGFNLAHNPELIAAFIEYRRQQTRKLLNCVLCVGRCDSFSLISARELAQIAGLDDLAARAEELLGQQ